MAIIDAQRIEGPRPHWILRGSNRELQVLEAGPVETFRIALIGTRTDRIKHNKLRQFARQMRQLGGPIVLADIRRSGVGANNTWGPLEFRSRLPGLLDDIDYSFMHLPELAPPETLLEDFRQPETEARDDTARPPRTWRDFAHCYRARLQPLHLEIGVALAEWSGGRGGWLVLLCAEQHLEDFDTRPEPWQQRHYCHRYSLATLIARQLRKRHPSTPIERVCLTLGDAPETAWLSRSGTEWLACAAAAEPSASTGTYSGFR